MKGFDEKPVKSRTHIVFIKYIDLFYFKWPIFSLDKTLIHHLVLFIVL